MRRVTTYLPAGTSEETIAGSVTLACRESLRQQYSEGTTMRWKTSVMLALWVVCAAGAVAGCQKSDKAPPPEPSANTTDSK